MASTLSRVTDFIPSTPILSSEVDAELNQLVNLLKGTSTNIKAVIRVDDAGDPPLELNQLGLGPIQEWFKVGVLLASVTNAGSFNTAGQFISSLATGTAPLVIASQTKVDNLNCDLLDGLNSLSFARKDDSSPQVFDGNLVVSANVPELILIDENHSKHIRFALENTTLFLINETLTQNIWTVDTATNVTTFTAIPVLPASNPTTANQAARKQYVDDQIATAVLLTGDQSVAGIKTFTSIPVLPASNPTTANQAARKQYVDDSIAAIDLSGVPRSLVSDATTNTTSGTGEDDLTSFTIPAGTLPSDGDYILFHAAGSMSEGGANINTLRARIAGNQLFSVTYNEDLNADWALDVWVIRLSDTSVRCISRYTRTHVNYQDSATAETHTQLADVAANSLSGSTNIFKCTGEVTNAAFFINQKWLGGEYVQR